MFVYTDKNCIFANIKLYSVIIKILICMEEDFQY